MKFPPPPKLSRFTIFFFGFTTIDKIDTFYNTRLQAWLYNYSHQKIKCVENAYNFFFLRHDEKGNINNAKFSGTTTDGIPLTEIDFLQRELYDLNRLIPSQLTLDEYKRVEYYRKYLEEKLKPKALEDPTKTDLETNPYPEVFKSTEAYQLFTRLYDNKKDSNSLLADFSFIYRRMSKDELLQDHQKPEVFRHWLSKEPFQVELDNKFKTLSNCTTQDKEEAYNSAKLLIQMRKE